VRGNEIADKLARSTSVQWFVRPEAFLGVSGQNIRRKMKCWMEKQHLALWCGPCSTQRQARELISGPDLATGTRLLSFNRTQSRVVIGLLTGHNTLRRHLYIMGLCNNATYRKCGTEEETSVHILCDVRPWPHSDIHIWVPSFWTQRTLGYWVWGLKEQGSYSLVQNMGHKRPVLRPRRIGPRRARTQTLFYSGGMDAFVQCDDTSCEHTRTLTSDASTKVLEGSTIQLYVDCEAGPSIVIKVKNSKLL
jgi:hypothetical protein